MTRELPTGLLTFLFTDIEGSTRLLLRLAEEYRALLETHGEVLREAIGANRGTEVSTEGDSFFAVFEHPADALHAAVEAQRGLLARRWPSGVTVRVRMGLHAGRAVLGGDSYVGLDVHRAARIAAAAHGGQIVVSATVREDLQESSEIGWRDLGLHRLKDLPEPEHLFQAQASGLPGDFPPPRSLEVRPHNLPSELSDFVGRGEELRAVEDLLERARLVTLIGPGGTGKTRLGLRVAALVLPRFQDGVFFVPLWGIRDPDLVVPTIATQFGVAESGDQPLFESLRDHLASRQVLLVIDSFEHVQPAAPRVGELLESAPELRILVTSRALLRVSGEHTFEVPPLSLPEPTTTDVERLLATDAVSLFITRARSVQGNFSPTPEQIEAIAEIASRLDGLPLAIELAAARTRLFDPVELLQRLQRRPEILRAEAASVPERHRTIADSIAWSYELLAEPEQAALRRLAVFSGGFTLEAAESVAAGPPVDDVIEAVASLLDNSLLRHLVIGGERRFTILNTIRDFALSQLRSHDEEEPVGRRHAEFFRDLATEAEHHLTRDDQAAWFERLGAEMGNLRAALGYSIERGDPDLGLRLAGSIWRIWHARGQPTEGRQWLERLLAVPGAGPPARAKGLTGLAGLAYWQGDYTTAWTCYEEALEIYLELGDRLGEADTLYGMSTTASWMGDDRRGIDLADRAREMFQELGADDRIGMVRMAEGFARWMKGDIDGARPLWEEGLAIAERLGDHGEAATTRLALASLSFQQGVRQQSLDDALAALRDLSEVRNVARMVMGLDWVAAFMATEDPTRAVRLAGAAAALRKTLGGGLRPEGVGLENARTVAERILDADTIEALWEEGQRMSLEEAVAEALQAPYSLTSV